MRPQIAAAVAIALASSAFANTPPHTPVIIEPSESARTIDPGDVHMATAPFADDDRGDALLCSDWEIRARAGQLVWYSYCATGVLAVHIHLGDGAFVNTEGHLLGDTEYEVRVRFRDSSGDSATEWSDWASRPFLTGPPSTAHPLENTDVLSSPPPRLMDAAGAGVTLPNGASVALVSEQGELLLSFSAASTDNPPALTGHARVKAVVRAGPQKLSLPDLNIQFADEAGGRHTGSLPSLSLPAGATDTFWIAQDGSSFQAFAGDTAPQFAILMRAADTPWRVTEPGYRVERVVGGLQLPVNIAFVPNPSADADAPLFYITELYGTIRAVLRDGTMRDYATGLLNFNPTGIFPGSGEHGAAGTVVDPETGDLFVAAVYASESGEHDPKVIRLHSADGGRTASTITTVLDMPGEEIGPSHQISSVSIGADGKLYVHVGDGFITPLATDLHSFRGKILRLNRDGTPPADNPFYDASDGITATDYIFAYGFRNPFGGAWRTADASLYEVENGPAVDRLAKVGAGINYQWRGSDDDMRAGAAYNWYPSAAPVNIAFVQPSTLGGSGYPAEKQDHAFVTESGPTWASGITELGKRIREFAFDAGGNVTATAPFVEYAGTGHATAAAIAAGPDGLYFSDLFPEEGSPTGHDANVYRIRHIGTATIGAEVIDEPAKTVRFTSIVTVPDYAELQWDFGDGSTGSEANPEHSYSENGPYDVRLSVTGAGGVVDDFTRVQFPDVPGAGLLAIYSDREGHQATRLDPNIDFDWPIDQPALPGESLDVTWSGEIAPTISALYQFELHTEGNALLLIDGRTVIDSSHPDAVTNPIRLEAGRRYTFVLQCTDTQMSGVTQLSWSAQGMPPRVVPSAAFYPLIARRRAAGH